MLRIVFRVYVLVVLCLVGCNTQIAVTGEARERLVNAPPFLAHWIKEGMTKESRRSDSWSCGALSTTYAADHGMVTEGVNQGGETDKRLSKQWRTCMQSKGYGYLENCEAGCLYP